MLRLSVPVLLIALAAFPAAAPAQNADVLSGFATDNQKPIQIDADRLVILDKEKKAEFIGNVKVVQGEMTMDAQKLTVFYSANAVSLDGFGAKQTPKTEASSSEKGGQPEITRVEVEGGITIKQRDQVAMGQKAVYEAAEQTVRLSGDVVLSQGANVVRGDVLVVNLLTRESKMESAGDAESGRVKLTVTPADEKSDAD